MSVCILDTETTGVIKKEHRLQYKKTAVMPRVIQLAYCIVSDDGQEELFEYCHKIRPKGWEVPREKFWIDNGFSTMDCERHGVDISQAMSVLVSKCKELEVDTIVCHNAEFDLTLIASEIYRLIEEDFQAEYLPKMKKLCTMKSSTDVLKIPSRHHSHGRYKFPSLKELYQYLFNSDFSGAHNALYDVRALARCFFEMVSRGLI